MAAEQWIEKLEAELQRSRAERDQLRMQNVLLRSDLQRALIMKDTIREEIFKILTTKSTELREELTNACEHTKQNVEMVTKDVRDEMQKIREQISGEFNKHNKELLLEIQQTQVKLMEAQRDLQRQLAVMRGKYEDLRRPKLRALTSDGDQLEALLSTCNFPQLLPISNMIKAMKRSSPGFIRLFGYPSHSPLLWFCVISSDIHIWANPLEKIAEESLENALKQFSEYYEIVARKVYLCSPSNISDKIIKFCNRLSKEAYEWKCRNAYHLFYMNEAQQKSVTEMKQHKLPSAYRFDLVHPNSDARLIAKDDEFCFDLLRCAAGTFQKRYECLPCVAVRRGDQLAGVAVFDIDGFYVPGCFTVPQEVRSALEMQLWQYSISKKFWPLQWVSVSNEDELRRFSESNLWTRLEDEHGNPITMNQMH